MYKCKICDKEFESSQKLGGHASSHKRGEEYSKKRRSKPDIFYEEMEAKKIAKFSTCKYCEAEFDKKSIGAHVILCKKNPSREINIRSISAKMLGKSVAEETKEKISNSMKISHSLGNAWNIGRSRWNNKKSYPEMFFESVINNEFRDKDFQTEFPVGIYSLDFAWIHLKKGIEIDGEQHERFDEYRERDLRKDEFCKKAGWEILRIKWKDLYHNTRDQIEIAKKFINGQVV
jgi:very-short-patch-repair endonuclease